MSLLSDSEASSDEENQNVRLKINEKFADRFERQERVKDLHRAKELLKNSEFDEDESESDSETEDEDAEQLSTGLDLKIIQTINSLRKRDPKIYDPSTKWFDEPEASDSSDDDNNDNQKVSKKKKYKDILREQLLEAEANGGMGDGDGIEASTKGVRDTVATNRLVYDAEQENIRQAFIKSASNIDKKKSKKVVESDEEDNDDDEDDILQVKTKSAQELKIEEIELKKALKEMRELSTQNNIIEKTKPNTNKTSVLELDESANGFLENYLEKQLWKENERKKNKNEFKTKIITGVQDDEEEEDLEGDEEELEEMERFESKYNFRFEELQAAQQQGSGDQTNITIPPIEVIGHSRNIMTSMRTIDDKRKVQRELRKERKEKEKRQQEAELRRLKNLKRQELRERLEQICKMSGLGELDMEDEDEGDINDIMGYSREDEEEGEEMNHNAGKKSSRKSRRGGKKAKKLKLNEDFLDEDWDPEKHEALMAAQFGDDYYEEDDTDFNVADLDDQEAYERYLGDDGLGEIDYDEEGDEEGGMHSSTTHATNNTNNKQEIREELRKTATAMADELYQLDYEDIVAGLPCRFKYKQVEKEGFGLTAEDILLAEDIDLNKYVSLKKISAYTQHSGVNDADLSKKRKRLRANVKERLAKEAEDAEKVGLQLKGTQPKTKEDDVDMVDGGEYDETTAAEASGSYEEDAKKRKRKRRKGTAVSALVDSSSNSNTVDETAVRDTTATIPAPAPVSKTSNSTTTGSSTVSKEEEKEKKKKKKNDKKPKEETAQQKRLNLYH